MKTLLLTGAAALFLATGTAHAVNAEPDFRRYSDHSFVCEDHYHNSVALDVAPGKMLVTLHNSKGEKFEFPITEGLQTQAHTRNAFGHDVYSWTIWWVKFQANGVKIRSLIYADVGIVYAPFRPRLYTTYSGPNNDGSIWSYNCIHSLTETEK